MRLTIAFIAFALSAPLAAQPNFPQDYTRVLLPIIIQHPTDGAHDSQWVTHAAITNTGTDPVSLVGYLFGCQIGPCGLPPLALPDITFYPDFPETSGRIEGQFLWVEKGREADVHVGLRVQDLSRGAQTSGTEMPVIPEASFLSTIAVLEDIPTVPNVRSNLRVYDLDSLSPHSARIRLYGVNPELSVPDFANPSAPTDQLFFDQTIPFSPSAGGQFALSRFLPAVTTPRRGCESRGHTRQRRCFPVLGSCQLDERHDSAGHDDQSQIAACQRDWQQLHRQ